MATPCVSAAIGTDYRAGPNAVRKFGMPGRADVGAETSPHLWVAARIEQHQVFAVAWMSGSDRWTVGLRRNGMSHRRSVAARHAHSIGP